jgi:hypothetical protein
MKVLMRNVREVVLGNLCFETWYFSPYPDNIIKGPRAKSTDTAVQNLTTLGGDGIKQDGIVCERLYVCPLCFRYTPDEVNYAQHIMFHQDKQKFGELMPVPDSAEKVYEWDGYVVWEVNGEAEKLYCQNLSLFAKLFLEQKSVFFDTGGFRYYVLTYTAQGSKGRGRGRKRASSGVDEPLFRTQVLGFFSKEDLSWDNNNLACILVFPPYQHRQLGQLLMAVSYKLSGWEWEGGIIGGPEKPLSTMGRKAYLRFWSERIARFFMGQSLDQDQHRVFEKTTKRKTGFAREEMTVKDIGDRTGMLAEDVIAALNDMKICDIKPARRKQKISSENLDTKVINGQSDAEEFEPAKMVVSRAKVLLWIENHKVDLVAPAREEGFLGEWALSDASDGLEDAEDQSDARPAR